MSDEVKTSMGMTFKAWSVPDKATISLPPGKRQDGMKMLPTLPLSALDPAALDALAFQWLTHLYASVARPVPFTKQEQPQ